MSRIIIAKKEEEKPKLISSPLHLVITLVIIIIFFFLLQTFLIKPYTIPSGSMKPTITPGERILVDRFAYRAGEPKIGDIVVFQAPVEEGEKTPCLGGYIAGKACFRPHGKARGVDYVKRIVALPGDSVSIKRGKLLVNGSPLFPQFATSCQGKGGACHLPGQIRVAKDHYFVAGDNRGDSFDSRYFGPIAKDWIIGKARITYWPVNKIGTF